MTHASTISTASASSARSSHDVRCVRRHRTWAPRDELPARARHARGGTSVSTIVVILRLESRNSALVPGPISGPTEQPGPRLHLPLLNEMRDRTPKSQPARANVVGPDQGVVAQRRSQRRRERLVTRDLRAGRRAGCRRPALRGCRQARGHRSLLPCLVAPLTACEDVVERPSLTRAVVAQAGALRAVAAEAAKPARRRAEVGQQAGRLLVQVAAYDTQGGAVLAAQLAQQVAQLRALRGGRGDWAWGHEGRDWDLRGSRVSAAEREVWARLDGTHLRSADRGVRRVHVRREHELGSAPRVGAGAAMLEQT